MTTPIIESHVEAERFRQRIAQLHDENDTLRDLADPAAGPVRLQAENILLRREAQTLRDLVPTLVAYDGPLPQSIADLDALAAPHRGQVMREHPNHVLKLRQVEQLLCQADSRDEAAAGVDPRQQGYL